MTYAIDFETFYEEGYGIEECGLYKYLHDKRFDPYLISIVTNEGLWSKSKWVGHPKDIPWKEFGFYKMCPKTFVAHNASFDRQVWERCVELGIIPDCYESCDWFCTANLSVFLGAPRNLKDASKHLLGVSVDKTMRNYMKGKTWQQAVDDGKADELKQYALDDSINCFNIWEKYNHLWPYEERRCAEITYQQTVRGIGVDVPLLDKALPSVFKAREDAFCKIPWAGTTNDKGEEVKPLAATALKEWCKKNNVEIPSTTEAKSPEFMKWQEENKDVAVVKAMQLYRSSNALYLKGSTLHRQVNPQGRYNFSMKYFGCTTGRWSAGYEDERNDRAGFNIQNVIKEAMYGLDLRKALIAGPGKKFVVSDYSQIEPRCQAWLCDDTEFLLQLGKGVPLYEAHARATNSWTGDKELKKADPKLYAQKKAEVLALGYGAGWAKFIFMCKMYGAEECLFTPITAAQKAKFVSYINFTRQQAKLVDIKTDLDWTKAVNAWLIVTEFRRIKPKICGRNGMWKRLESDCASSVGTDYTVELPSGRLLKYFNIRLAGGLTGSKVMGEPEIKLWGGFLTENVTQAVARDVMRDAITRLEDEGICTLFTVHDEIVCEVDKDFDPKIIRDIMNVTPDWMPGIPLDITQEETLHYKK